MALTFKAFVMVTLFVGVVWALVFKLRDMTHSDLNGDHFENRQRYR